MEEINQIDKLFDDDNYDNITLINENGEPGEYEQIALIRMGEVNYAILKPTFKLDDVAEDEGLVFEIKTNEESDGYLELVNDELIIEDVFSVYLSYFEEEEES